MNLKVNGEERQSEKRTLNELLEELGIMPERVAVEVNLKIIKKADHDMYQLSEGDVIEIVNFVGGG
jgi:thiamine biosynthesis protein ThiS